MQLVSLILIHWIVIYPLDSAIQRLNNRGQNYRVIFVQTISRKYVKPQSLSNIKLLNPVLLLEIFIDYHCNDVPVMVLKV